MKVEKQIQQILIKQLMGNNKNKYPYDFVISCQPNTVNAIRSALTMVTTPSYFEPSNVYRFDTFIIQEEDEEETKKTKIILLMAEKS